MNPDQTAPWEQSDLGPYCLQYRLQKREQMTKVLTGGKGLTFFEGSYNVCLCPINSDGHTGEGPQL